MSTLDDAIAAWESACSAYEDGLRSEDTDGEALEELREELFEAERGIDGAVEALIGSLKTDTAGLLDALKAGLAAKVRVQEHSALEAERTARHGELAGAGTTERERIGRLEYAAESLRGVVVSLREALEALEDLDV